jgi:hypothetical protein
VVDATTGLAARPADTIFGGNALSLSPSGLSCSFERYVLQRKAVFLLKRRIMFYSAFTIRIAPFLLLDSSEFEASDPSSQTFPASLTVLFWFPIRFVSDHALLQTGVRTQLYFLLTYFLIVQSSKRMAWRVWDTSWPGHRANLGLFFLPQSGPISTQAFAGQIGFSSRSGRSDRVKRDDGCERGYQTPACQRSLVSHFSIHVYASLCIIHVCI